MVRRVPLVMKAEDKVVAALSIDLLRVASGAGGILVRSDQSGIRNVVVSTLEMPTDQNGRVWISFQSTRHGQVRFGQGRHRRKCLTGKVFRQTVLIALRAIGLWTLRPRRSIRRCQGRSPASYLKQPSRTRSLNCTHTAMVFEMLAAWSPADPDHACAHGKRYRAVLVAALAGFTILRILDAVQRVSGRCLTRPSADCHAFRLYSVALVGYFREQSDRRRIGPIFPVFVAKHR
jgi:hypothetical protein